MAKVTNVQRAANPITSLTLELTGEEAAVLRSILKLVGGSPDGPRGHMDQIAIALDGSGVVPSHVWADRSGWGTLDLSR